MTPLPWIPRFTVGGSVFPLRYPVTRWVFSARTTGVSDKSADGAPGVAVQLRRYMIGFSIRFLDSEWSIVRDFLKLAQSGQSVIWEPQAQMLVPDMPSHFNCFLESPHVTDIVLPARDSEYLHVQLLPLVLSSASVFHAYYFPVT